MKRRRPARRAIARSFLPLAIVLVELVSAAAALAQDHKQVLVLYSTRRDAEFSSIGERELPRLLDVGLGRNLDYYSEFIDIARFPDPSYQTGFAEFLRVKYNGIRFDVVIAMQDFAVEFVDRNRATLFGEAPVVFLANSLANPDRPNATGLIQRRDFTGTLALIERLQPDVRNVFVVTGAAAADKAYEEAVRAQTRSSSSRLTLTYLSGLPTNELERRLAALPPGSAVYYLLVTEDGAGDRYHPLDYVDRMAGAANAPTYSWVDSTMERGIVGGDLYSQTEAIRRTGELALRVLRGERPDNIDTSAIDLNASQVDWRQLQRWNIDEARVPAGTVIRFREPTIWDRYQAYILSALAVLLVQSALIAGLLVQRARRHRAELELRRSQGHLRASYDRIRDLGSRLLKAHETERARIARELHDDVNQQLALLTTDLELAGDGDDGDVKQLAAEALVRAKEIARSVHDLSHRLHPAKLRLIGLIPALQALAAELSQSGVAIAFTHDQVPSPLPADVTLCLFRVSQEALQNAVKYSKAHQISVHLGSSPLGLTLTIVDDGAGFDVDAVWGTGLGLVSMNERLEAIGGALHLHSRPGAGTRVEATIPFAIIQRGDVMRPDINAKLGSTATH